jgi:hypothetical protein
MKFKRSVTERFLFSGIVYFGVSDRAHGAGEVSLGAKIVFILLAGALSMFFAEVCSGSSVLWFVTTWAWLVTFWLYLAHTVFFANLALIYRRISLTSLYLWGVLFGLYESWITKVVWAGYAGSTPAHGTILGFAVIEFPLIVFFWHPVFSFIMPVLTFEVLSGEKHILPGHLSVLTKNRRNRAFVLMIALIGALCLSFNAHGNVFASDLSIIGSIALIAGLYWIASRKYTEQFSIESLRLGKKGMAVLVIYLSLLYVGAFIFILPQRIPPPLTLLMTLGLYAAICILLYLKKPDGHAQAAGRKENTFNIKDLALLFIILLALTTLVSLTVPFDYIFVIVIYISMYVTAFVLLALAILRIIKERRTRGRKVF